MVTFPFLLRVVMVVMVVLYGDKWRRVPLKQFAEAHIKGREGIKCAGDECEDDCIVASGGERGAWWSCAIQCRGGGVYVIRHTQRMKNGLPTREREKKEYYRAVIGWNVKSVPWLWVLNHMCQSDENVCLFPHVDAHWKDKRKLSYQQWKSVTCMEYQSNTSNSSS